MENSSRIWCSKVFTNSVSTLIVNPCMYDRMGKTTPEYEFSDPSPAFHYVRATPSGAMLATSKLGVPPAAAPPLSSAPAAGASTPATPTGPTSGRRYGEQPDSIEELDRNLGDFIVKCISNKVYGKALSGGDTLRRRGDAKVCPRSVCSQ